jgi:hypothetical protein
MKPPPAKWKPVGEAFPLSALQAPPTAPRTTTDGFPGDGAAPKQASPAEKFNFFRHRWLAHVARDAELPGAAIRVAVMLWEYQNAKWGCAWPALTTIATELKINKSTVIRSLDILRTRDWITVKRRGGRHRSNEYRLAFGSMADDPKDDDGRQS